MWDERRRPVPPRSTSASWTAWGRSPDFARESEADAARWITGDHADARRQPPKLRRARRRTSSLSQGPPPRPRSRSHRRRSRRSRRVASSPCSRRAGSSRRSPTPGRRTAQIDADAEEVVEVWAGRTSDGWVEVHSPRRGGSGAIPASYLASTAPDAPAAVVRPGNGRPRPRRGRRGRTCRGQTSRISPRLRRSSPERRQAASSSPRNRPTGAARAILCPRRRRRRGGPRAPRRRQPRRRRGGEAPFGADEH